MADETQDTRETEAVQVPDEHETPASDATAASATTGEPAGDSPAAGGGTGGDSPAAAQERASGGEVSPIERPEVQILGAFVGAFILAKLLQRIFGSD
jgi:hypothetical protein